MVTKLVIIFKLYYITPKNTFTESVGISNVIVYDADNQLVDMVTVDTSINSEIELSTELWITGKYRLVVSYGTTTLQGNFNF